MNPTQQKFQTLYDELLAETVEMETEAHAAILALSTGSHLFFLGKPGLAKTYLIDRMIARIANHRHYHILLGNFTGPEDMYGPLDLAGLKAGHYRHLTKGYLPEAQTAFLDEIWKGNDAILNSQLALINERKFKNDGIWGSVPLSTLFGASNELPANESLAAIYDRLEQRIEVQDIIEPQNFIDMLKLDVPEVPDVVLDWNDVEEAKRQISQVAFNPDVYEAMAEIRRELAGKNIFPSPRRFKRSLKLLQGEAWLDDCGTVEPDHVSVLCNVLWDNPEQRTQVEKTVLDRVNPLEKETRKLLGEIGNIGDMVQKAKTCSDADERQQQGMEAHARLLQASEDLEGIQAKAGNSKRQAALVSKCKSSINHNAAILKYEVFDFKDEDGNDKSAP